MAHTERVEIGSVEVVADGVIFITEHTIFETTDTPPQEVSRAFKRTTKIPGSDVSDQPQLVQDIAGVVWTPAVIAAYEAKFPVGA